MQQCENADLGPFDWLDGRALGQGEQDWALHALALDHMLWRGHAANVLPRLHALLEQGPAIERAAAGWVLARWLNEEQEFVSAYRALMIYHRHPEGLVAVSHPGPFLLGISLCIACGDLDGARNLLEKGVERFGHSPDFTLARFQLARMRGEPLESLSVILSSLHAPTGLAPIALSGSGETLFDMLACEREPLPESSDLPLVSVIIPVFNSEGVLSTALRGLLSQTWSNLDIIVVDDGSQDQSSAIARKAATADRRIRVIQLDRNQGAYPARNEGFRQARGVFVTVHDADDWSHPQKIECQARCLLENPSAKASVSHWVRAGNALEMTRWRMEEGWVYRNVSSLMIRATLRGELGYWDRAKVNADTEYYYRIIKAFGESAVREVHPGVPLAFARTLPDSLTNRGSTHLRTQFRGVRRDYMEAAHDWHRRAGDLANLYLPQHPPRRPFRISASVGLGDPEAPVSAYDTLLQSDLLDEGWYQRAYPDVVQSGISAARHYLEAGAQENRDPGPLFSTSGYRRAQALDPGVNPLLHYLSAGQSEGYSPLPAFSGTLPADAEDGATILVFAHSAAGTIFGAERSLLDVLARLVRNGSRPVVVMPALHNPDYLERLRKTAAVVEILPQTWRHGLFPPDEATVEAMRALIWKHQPREVHVNTVVQEAPLVAARREGVESVVYVREVPAEDPALCRGLGMDARTLHASLLDQADRFVVPSCVVADWLGCPERVTVRPNAVDEALFDLPFRPGRFLNVALVSSNVAKKGVGDFFETARLVAISGRAVRFVLVGPPTDDVERLQPIPPNLRFRNYAPSPALAIAQADIVLSLSHFAESFGRTVVEAMAAGRPVICYDRGAPPSLVIDGETGIVVPADIPQGVANAVLTLDADRSRLEAMSHAARRRARAIQKQALA